MFRRSPANLDEVRTKLMKLITDSAGGYALSQQQLIKKAERILTKEVSLQLDSKTNKNADEACIKLVGEKYLSSLPGLDVSNYLTLVVAIAEQNVIKETASLLRLREFASSEGRNYLLGLYEEFIGNGRYVEAELTAHQILTCLKLWPYPHWQRMFTYYQLSVAQTLQEKNGQAKDTAQLALKEYGQLKDQDKQDKDVQEALVLVREIISNLNKG